MKCLFCKCKNNLSIFNYKTHCSNCNVEYYLSYNGSKIVSFRYWDQTSSLFLHKFINENEYNLYDKKNFSYLLDTFDAEEVSIEFMNKILNKYKKRINIL